MDVSSLYFMKCIALFTTLILSSLYNRFTASPTGTHWYHSHHGAMRREGLNGAFIVLPQIKKEVSEGRLQYWNIMR